MTAVPRRTIGVAGLGSIGRRHARVFAGIEGVSVVAYDPVPSPPDDGVAVQQVASLEALLARDLTGLVVASPDRFHAEATVAACEAGVPVLVEKPLAASSAEAGRIVRAASDADVPLLVGYVLRSYRCMRRAHGLIASGAIGEPVSFQAMLGAYETLVVARNRFGTAEEGRLYFDYSHEWDYLRWLLGPVEGGFALAREAGDLPLSQPPNVVDAVLSLRSGVTGTVHLDYVQARGRRSFTVVGDRGSVSVDVGTGTVLVARGAAPPSVEDHGQARDAAFRDQAEHFLRVAAGQEAPRADAHDGLAAVCVAEALRESASTGSWQTVREPAAPDV